MNFWNEEFGTPALRLRSVTGVPNSSFQKIRPTPYTQLFKFGHRLTKFNPQILQKHYFEYLAQFMGKKYWLVSF